jgi:hypothetical protein
MEVKCPIFTTIASFISNTEATCGKLKLMIVWNNSEIVDDDTSY